MIVGWHTQELSKLVSSPWIWFYCLCGFYCLPSVKVKVCWNMLIIFSSLKTTVPECFTGDRSWQRIQIRGSIWWREEKNSWQWKLYNQSPQLSNIERVGQTRRNRPDCRSQDKCLHPWPSIPIYHRIWSDLEVSTHSGLYHLGIWYLIKQTLYSVKTEFEIKCRSGGQSVPKKFLTVLKILA